MAERVVIERRFRGPPDSAQGGYACGLVAERVEGPCTSVSLRMPPPLEQPLDVDRGDDGSVTLRAAENVVAEGGPVDAQQSRGGAAIHGPDGEVCAWSVGLWIELRDPASFGAAT